MLGGRLGRYALEAKVGSGRMGTVYRARDEGGRRVAVKVLSPDRLADDDARSRFRQEARILAALDHPNIAAFRDFGEDRLQVPGERARVALFLVTEWVGGSELSALLADGPLAPQSAVRLAVQMAAALEAAHCRGVIHRDLKPGNVRLAIDGRLKVLDFGLAKVLEHAELGRRRPRTYKTSLGALIGSAPYLSPEQIAGRPADERSDLFALGVVLYQLLSGELPFRGDNLAGTLEALSGPRPARPLAGSIDRGLTEVVERLLDKAPEQRLAPATAVRHALEVFA